VSKSNIEHIVLHPEDFKDRWGKRLQMEYADAVEDYVTDSGSSLLEIALILEESKCPRSIVSKAWTECRNANTDGKVLHHPCGCEVVTCRRCGAPDKYIRLTLLTHQMWRVHGQDEETVKLMPWEDDLDLPATLEFRLVCAACKNVWYDTSRIPQFDDPYDVDGNGEIDNEICKLALPFPAHEHDEHGPN